MARTRGGYANASEESRDCIKHSCCKKLIEAITTANAYSRPLKIKPFDTKQDIVSWARDYEEEGRLEGWPEALLGKQLAGYLKGSALDWWRSQRRRFVGVEDSWPSTKALLIQAYRQKWYDGLRERELTKIQTPNEDALTFFDKRRYLCEELCMSEDEIFENIVSKLRPNVQPIIVTGAINNLEQLRERILDVMGSGPGRVTACEG